MKATILWKGALVVSALLAFLFTILGEAAPMGEAGPQVATQPVKVMSQPVKVTSQPVRVTTRPLSEFLDAQGSTSVFFPLVPDYVGWTDNVDVEKAVNFALVDYAGLANGYLRGKLHTHVNGFVVQNELADGSARVAVALFTTHALGFAQSVAALRSNGFDFLNTPTIFGNKAQDVARGAEAAVGDSTFLITFSLPSARDPLPDLVKVVDFVNHPEFSPVNISFTAIISEKCKHGTRAVLYVDQEGPPDVPLREIVEIVREPCH